MTLSRGLLAGSAVIAMIGTTACTTNPETGNQRVSNAAIGGVAGAVGGYLIGDLVGGRRDRTERIVGAGAGDVEVPRSVDGDAAVRERAAVKRVSGTVSGEIDDLRDGRVGSDLERVVAGTSRDEDVTRTVHGNTEGVI